MQTKLLRHVFLVGTTNHRHDVSYCLDQRQMMTWKEIALQMETDPRVRKVLLEGPKKLTDAWMLQAMKFKYRRFEK